MAKVVKSTMTHPRSGREMNIDAATYKAIEAAIRQSLKGSKALSFTELSNSVTGIIKKKLPGFKGSVSWYTISVRLDLETKGIVETFTEKGKKYSRLKK